MSGDKETKLTTATYASGEIPAIGDVVECVEDSIVSSMFCTKGQTDNVVDVVRNCIKVKSTGKCCEADRFRLLSRATPTPAVEPVSEAPPELLASLDDIIRQVELSRDSLQRLYEDEKSPFLRTPFGNNERRCRDVIKTLEGIRGDLLVSKVVGERTEQKESEAESCR